MEKTRREKSCVCVELFLEKFHYYRYYFLFFKKIFIYLFYFILFYFIFGCVGSSLLCAGFL